MGPSLEALQVLALEALQVLALEALQVGPSLEALQVLEVEERQEAGVLLLEGEVKVSCLLRQPRYQAQEVRVPFERIGGDGLYSCRVGEECVGLHGFYGLPSP